MVAQFFGTALLALGGVLWFAKDAADDASQRGMGIGVLIGSAAGLIVTILAAVGGSLRAFSWIAVLLYVLVGLGFAYLVFLKPAVKE